MQKKRVPISFVLMMITIHQLKVQNAKTVSDHQQWLVFVFLFSLGYLTSYNRKNFAQLNLSYHSRLRHTTHSAS